MTGALERQLLFLSTSNPVKLERGFRKALLENSNDVDALREYAHLLTGAGLVQEARAYFDAAISRTADPESAKAYALAAKIDLAGASNQLQEAVRVAEEYVRLHPSYTISLFGLVVKNAALGNFRDAERHLERLTQTDHEGRFAYAATLELAAQRGELRPGTAEFDEAFSDARLSNIARGRIYFVLGMVDEGVAAWREMEAGLAHLLWPWVHQWQYLFAEGVWEDPRFQILLEDFSLGARWQRYLIDRVDELASATGIQPATIVQVPTEPRLLARYAPLTGIYERGVTTPPARPDEAGSFRSM